MTGFYYDNKNSGNFLIYSPQKEDELDAFTLGMLSNNNIPGLLPVRFVQMNNERQFMYNVTARVSLKQYVAGSVTRKRCIDIFRGIAGTALSISEFMLDYSSIIFDDDYMFIDVSTNELLMVCLPIVRESQNHDMKAYFRQLISSMLFSDEGNMEYPAQILNILNGKSFVVDQIGIGKRRRSKEGNYLSEGSFSLEHFMKQLEAMRGKEVDSSSSVVQPQQRNQTENVIAKPGIFSDSELFDFGVSESDTGFERGRKNRNSGQGRGIADLFRRIRNRWAPKDEGGAGDTDDFLQKLQPVPEQGVLGFGETTFLGDEHKSSETMLLSEQEFQEHSGIMAYLLRQKSDETVEISGDTFKIGKERQYVDYCIEDNPTVSRSHADIIRKEKNFYIIDNSSTNHTYLDGEVIPSCKQMLLKNGSEIVLGNELFTFYCR